MAEDGFKVSLNVYDLSQGLARQLSSSLLGKVIDGVWHTGIVVYGNEYYFGGGIQHSPAGTTPYGTPVRVVDLGVTHVPKELFEEYLQEISPRYTAETYVLLEHNCNNFSNEVAQFLVGATIPEYILQLPNDVKNSPMGALILPMIQQLEATLRAGAVPQPPQFRAPAAAAKRSAVGRGDTTVTGISGHPLPKATNVRAVERGTSSQEAVNAVATGNGCVNKILESSTEKAADPLVDARNRVHEEITKEFAAIMASGTLRASEAAALATRRVMRRYGDLNVSAQ